MITHKLKETEDGYEVWLGPRNLVYTGKTKEEAYNAALTGVGLLCREGCLNPHDPELPGVGRVAHVISLAGEALQHTLKQTVSDEEWTRYAARQKVAALATALAALARVNLD